eukprot:12003_1
MSTQTNIAPYSNSEQSNGSNKQSRAQKLYLLSKEKKKHSTNDDKTDIDHDHVDEIKVIDIDQHLNSPDSSPRVTQQNDSSSSLRSNSSSYSPFNNVSSSLSSIERTPKSNAMLRNILRGIKHSILYNSNLDKSYNNISTKELKKECKNSTKLKVTNDNNNSNPNIRNENIIESENISITKE